MLDDKTNCLNSSCQEINKYQVKIAHKISAISAKNRPHRYRYPNNGRNCRYRYRYISSSHCRVELSGYWLLEMHRYIGIGIGNIGILGSIGIGIGTPIFPPISPILTWSKYHDYAHDPTLGMC